MATNDYPGMAILNRGCGIPRRGVAPRRRLSAPTPRQQQEANLHCPPPLPRRSEAKTGPLLSTFHIHHPQRKGATAQIIDRGMIRICEPEGEPRNITDYELHVL